MRFVAIIPARYASTRFPGKPLAMLGGKPVIERVYQRVSEFVDEVVVATDDQRIFEVVSAFGGKVVLTSSEHQSGTDRCYEALQKIEGDFDVIVNVQGDEPFVTRHQILSLVEAFSNSTVDIATLAVKISQENGIEYLENPSHVKVVRNIKNEALYFSRSVIPYNRNLSTNELLQKHKYLKHLGLYAYKVNVLKEIASLQVTSLEKMESLEQLRWLENGYKIFVGETEQETIGIDTPEDLIKAEKYLTENGIDKIS